MYGIKPYISKLEKKEISETNDLGSMLRNRGGGGGLKKMDKKLNIGAEISAIKNTTEKNIKSR